MPPTRGEKDPGGEVRVAELRYDPDLAVPTYDLAYL